ncbi:hypothetical protein J4450_00535 [Candidatus Micrarchaeota archaeon]|nr:hypothetical protein [Candidatus Micrarchaeota archaeon]
MKQGQKQKQRYLREMSIREPVEKPAEHSIDKDIEWVCECLGLSDSENDIAKDIFKELLRATKGREGITTRQIVDSEKTNKKVTQGAIVYHINMFMSHGLVIKQGRRYFLRSASLDETIEELEQDMLRRMRKLRELAKHIDEEMEAMFREF